MSVGVASRPAAGADPTVLRGWLTWQRAERIGLALLLVTHLTLALLYSVATPLLEGWDEVGHFVALRHVSRPDVYPSATPPDLPNEANQPPLFYLIAGKLFAPLLPSQAWSPDLNGSSLTVQGGRNFVLHSGAEDFPYRGVFLYLHAIRLFNALISCLLTLAIYFTARLLTRGPTLLPLLAGALASFVPTWLELSGIMANDALAIVGAAVALFFGVRVLTQRDRHFFWVGLVVGLALITKLTALFIAPVFLVFAVFCAARSGQAKHLLWWPLQYVVAAIAVTLPWLISGGSDQLAGFVGPAVVDLLGLFGRSISDSLVIWLRPRPLVGVAAVLLGLDGVMLAGRYGRTLHRPWIRRVVVAGLAILTVVAILLPRAERAAHLISIGFVFRSAMASFGTGVVEAPARTYYLYGATAALLLLWLLVEFWRNEPLVISRMAVTGLILFAVAAWLPPLARGIKDNDVLLMHGRFFLVALPALSIVLATPLAGFLGIDFKGVAAGAALSAMLAVAALLVALRSIVPAYEPPPALSAGAASSVPRNLGADFSGYFTLLGYTTDIAAITPGETLTVNLYWRDEKATDVNWEVGVHLLDPISGASLAAVDNFPVHGLRPTSGWRPGEVIADSYQLQLPASTPPQQVAHLAVGVFRLPPTLTYLTYRVNGGPPGNSYLIGDVTIGGQARPPLGLDFAGQRATFGGAFALQGMALSSATVAPGSKLDVTLHWHDLQALPQPFTTFVHVLDDQNQVIAQSDSPPKDGAYPTNVWQPGEDVYDSHSVTLPEGFNGTARIEVGLYDSRTQQRLAPDVGGSSLIAGQVTVLS